MLLSVASRYEDSNCTDAYHYVCQDSKEETSAPKGTAIYIRIIYRTSGIYRVRYKHVTAFEIK